MTAIATWKLKYSDNTYRSPDIDITSNIADLELTADWTATPRTKLYYNGEPKEVVGVELHPKAGFTATRATVEVIEGGCQGGLPASLNFEIQPLSGPPELDHKFGVFKLPGWTLKVKVNRLRA